MTRFINALQLALASSACIAQPSAERLNKHNALWLSDFHIDQYYGTSSSSGSACNSSNAPAYGIVGCDSPMLLAVNALKSASEIIPDPEFVLVTGDYLRHRNDETPLANSDFDAYQESIFSTIKLVSDLIDTFFPNAKKVHITDSVHSAKMYENDLMVMLGNNDFDHDYYLNVTNDSPRNPYLSDLSDYLRTQMTNEQHDSFAYGGYYSGEVMSGLHIISLNTVIYSHSHSPQTNEADPFSQFVWLKNTLEDIRNAGHVAYLTGHISPSYDSYGPSLLWETQYLKSYFEIVKDYDDVIQAHLYGHIHSSETRAFNSTDYGDAPFLLGCAISPIYGNSPCFSTIQIDMDTKALSDWGIYATLDIDSIEHTIDNRSELNQDLEVVTWEPIFESAKTYFDLNNLTNLQMLNYFEGLHTDDEAWAKWLYQYRQGNPQLCVNECRTERICAFSSYTKEELNTCINTH
eukprot:CFRG2143T1